MRKTSNLDLRLYDASDKFDITNTSNSLNSNMEIIDEQVNNLNNNIKGIDELKKETASLKYLVYYLGSLYTLVSHLNSFNIPSI